MSQHPVNLLSAVNRRASHEYQAGVAAFWNRDSERANPYPIRSDKAGDWAAGWLSAYTDHEEDQQRRADYAREYPIRG